MEDKKYRKAMHQHGEKLEAYACEIHETVDRMRADGCTLNDIVGLLEAEKSYRLFDSMTEARAMAMLDCLDELPSLSELLDGTEKE